MFSTPRFRIGLALAVLAVAAPAQAAEDVDFSLVPLGADRYFIFDANPGQTVVGRLGVVSRSERRQRIALRTVDVGTAVTGGLDYGLRAPGRVGSWLSLGRRELTLGPGAVATVPFEARVPDRTRAGDHLGGLVAYGLSRGRRSRPSAARGMRLVFRSRLAVAVQVRLPGRRRPRLSFRGATIVDSPSGVRIQLRLANTGNTLVERTTGRVRVSQGAHDALDIPVDIDTFAPDSEISYPLLLPGAPVQGTYHVEGTLRPAGAPSVRITADVELTGRQATRIERATGTKVARAGGSSPWALIALLLPVLIAAVFAVAYRNARH